jgi:hypothetical protein
MTEGVDFWSPCMDLDAVHPKSSYQRFPPEHRLQQRLLGVWNRVFGQWSPQHQRLSVHEVTLMPHSARIRHHSRLRMHEAMKVWAR